MKQARSSKHNVIIVGSALCGASALARALRADESTAKRSGTDALVMVVRNPSQRFRAAVTLAHSGRTADELLEDGADDSFVDKFAAATEGKVGQALTTAALGYFEAHGLSGAPEYFQPQAVSYTNDVDVFVAQDMIANFVGEEYPGRSVTREPTTRQLRPCAMHTVDVNVRVSKLYPVDSLWLSAQIVWSPSPIPRTVFGSTSTKAAHDAVSVIANLFGETLRSDDSDVLADKTPARSDVSVEPEKRKPKARAKKRRRSQGGSHAS